MLLMKRIILGGLITILLSVIAFSLFNKPVLANPPVHVDECNEVFTYYKSDDFNDNRVNINFENSDEQIDVSADPGYKVVEVALDVEDDNHQGLWVYATGDLDNFNPNPGHDIDNARVKVKKVCTEVCNDKEANNYQELVKGQTVSNNELCEYATHRWCKLSCGDLELTSRLIQVCENPTYEAIAVPNNQDNPEGKPWETGMDRYCEFPVVTPSPTPTPTLTPAPTPIPVVHYDQSDGRAPGVSTPQCNSTTPNKAPQNLHIYRNGDQAKVVWFYEPAITWKVVVYYGLTGQGDQHSVILNNNQSGYTITGLGNRDFDFRAIYLNDCAGSQSTKSIIDGVTSKWVLFR